MTTFDKTPRNTVKRIPNRGQYDADTIYPIVDAALICHVGFEVDGQPYVIPTIHARVGDVLYIHGSAASRMLRHSAEKKPVCVTITHLDGLVLARSAFHNSMNYRSAVLFGEAYLVEDEKEKLDVLIEITDRLMPHRWDDSRPVTANEMKGTSVIAIPIASASAKIRTGHPGDDEEDYALPIWSGVIPFKRQTLDPVPDERLMDGVEVPAYITEYLAENQ